MVFIVLPTLMQVLPEAIVLTTNIIFALKRIYCINVRLDVEDNRLGKSLHKCYNYNTGVNVNYTGATVNTLFLEYLVRGFYLFQIKQLNICTANSIKVVLPKAY